MNRPISNGAMTPFHAARSSVATVRITMTNSPVATISSTSAAQLSIPASRLRVQRVRHGARVDDRHHEHRGEPADELCDPVREHLARREPARDGRAGLTAGLKCPPERCPKAVIATARPNPNPAATPSECDRSRADLYQCRDAGEAEKEEHERSERLCPETHAERLIHVRPPNRGFAPFRRTGANSCVRRESRERATGLEPATSSLEGWRSTN